jgi:5-formyltetrahydrofolate cyclo-ligase
MDTASAKLELRKTLNLQRPQSSLGLFEQLRSLAKKTQATKIASYSPLENEPDLEAFNNWAAENLNLYFPRVVQDKLEFAQGPLRAGKFKIMEPTGSVILPSELDLILIPALAVDALGNRLGKGMGFYDRWLVDVPSTNLFAVVFDSEVLELVPNEPHDKKVNGIVTPTRLIAI